MKKPVFLSLLLSLLLCAVALVLSGCNYSRQDTDANNINLLDLLFGPSDMPPHWPVVNYGIGDPYRSSDAVAIVFFSDLYPEALGLGEEVYRFDTVASAKDDYSDELKIVQRPSSFVPQEWTFSSDSADENFFACSTAPNFTSCTWLARYNTIVIEFRGVLIPNRSSIGDMEKLAKIIDEKASKLIKKEN